MCGSFQRIKIQITTKLDAWPVQEPMLVFRSSADDDDEGSGPAGQGQVCSSHPKCWVY